MLERYRFFTHRLSAILKLTRPRATRTQSNDFLRKIWAPRAFISAGGYTRDTAMKRADETGEMIAFGRWFIANVLRRPLTLRCSAYSCHAVQPDLPDRLKQNIPIIKWSKSMYDGAVDPRGYIDYPFAGEEANKNYELIDPRRFQLYNK